MKKPSTQSRAEKTREAICLALADVIAGSPVGEFSVQEVADRAGVTHRTVYNHFPNRQALVDGLNAFQEDRWRRSRNDQSRSLRSPAQLPGSTFDNLDFAPSVDEIADVAPVLYSWAAYDEKLSRAVAMLSLTSPRLSDRTRDRTERFAETLATDLVDASPEELRLVAVAVRVFASQVGWHLLTQPFGLTQDEAERTAAWATRVLLDAARSGHGPGPRCRQSD